MVQNKLMFKWFCWFWGCALVVGLFAVIGSKAPPAAVVVAPKPAPTVAATPTPSGRPPLEGILASTIRLKGYKCGYIRDRDWDILGFDSRGRAKIGLLCRPDSPGVYMVVVDLNAGASKPSTWANADVEAF